MAYVKMMNRTFNGRSGSPNVDHVDERFFFLHVKNIFLSRLWEKQIGSCHLDV